VALAKSLQNALWALGGVLEQHRGDSLSTAFGDLDRDAHPLRPLGTWGRLRSDIGCGSRT
jgi:hypothetical protein